MPIYGAWFSECFWNRFHLLFFNQKFLYFLLNLWRMIVLICFFSKNILIFRILDTFNFLSQKESTIFHWEKITTKLNGWLHRSTAKTVLAWNQLFPYDFGSLNPNPASVFPHHVEILQYCQFHGCQVRKSVYCVLWKNYKRYRKFNYI